jgi:D-sedoheptulose 7-phosphate isomerase
MIMDYKQDIQDYFLKLKKTIDAISVENFNDVLNVLVEGKNQDRTIFIMGNGGSAATASHFVCDFNKGLSVEGAKRFKFICLNDNVPTVMAIANDLSYEDIFVEQLKNFFKVGDLVIGISGSGNSMNVIKAIEYANTNGGITIGFSGYDGGKLMKQCKYNINIPVSDMQITEDLHMVLDHCMMRVLSINNNKDYNG